MADRALVKYYEPLRSMPESYTGWRLVIERSASGKPDLFFIVYDPDGVSHCVVVDDAPTVLAPLIEWLESKK